IAHVSTTGMEYLQRLRTKLDQVAIINDERVPRVAAWCHSDSGKAWAVLVCHELPGQELNPMNATPSVLESLADLLLRLHAVEAPTERRDAIVFTPDDVAGF